MCLRVSDLTNAHLISIQEYDIIADINKLLKRNKNKNKYAINDKEQ